MKEEQTKSTRFLASTPRHYRFEEVKHSVLPESGRIALDFQPARSEDLAQLLFSICSM